MIVPVHRLCLYFCLLLISCLVVFGILVIKVSKHIPQGIIETLSKIRINLILKDNEIASSTVSY